MLLVNRIASYRPVPSARTSESPVNRVVREQRTSYAAATQSSVDLQVGTPKSVSSTATIRARRANFAVASVAAAVTLAAGPVAAPDCIRRSGCSGTVPVFFGSAGAG